MKMNSSSRVSGFHVSLLAPTSLSLPLKPPLAPLEAPLRPPFKTPLKSSLESLPFKPPSSHAKQFHLAGVTQLFEDSCLVEDRAL